MLEIESLAIGVKIVVGMSITVGLMVGVAFLKTILRNRPRYARPNFRKGSLPPTDKIPCWRVLTILVLVGALTGCQTLVSQREGPLPPLMAAAAGRTQDDRLAALEERSDAHSVRLERVEERSDAHSVWIIVNTGLSVGGFIISLGAWYKGEGIIDGMKAARAGH